MKRESGSEGSHPGSGSPLDHNRVPGTGLSMFPCLSRPECSLPPEPRLYELKWPGHGPSPDPPEPRSTGSAHRHPKLEEPGKVSTHLFISCLLHCLLGVSQPRLKTDLDLKSLSSSLLSCSSW